MQHRPPRAPLVSVVVPVFEPGDAIEPCVESLLAQSLPADDLELIFVDDGSRDGTPDRLDALAAAHPHVRVTHEPGSGWAGRPRNVGIELAAGRYIQFVDQDDRLGPEALARCVAMAEANGTDIVIGKVSSDFRGVPHGLFTRDRPSETVWTAPLIDSLTPHKLFRRSFLMEHAIRFPEGRRRLEDQLFMVRAYFAGATASVLASYPCYFYLERADRSNAGSAAIDPAGYYGNLREVLDVVIDGTSPGPDRDRFLARFLRVELLGRLEGDILRGDEAYRRALVDEVATTIETRIPAGATATLAPVARARLELVRQRDADGLVAWSGRTRPLQSRTTVRSATWRDGRFRLQVEASIATEDGRPLAVVAEGPDRTILDPALTAEVLPAPLEVSGALQEPRLQVYLESLEDRVLWRALERDIRPSAEHPERVAVAARIVIDARTAAAGGPLPAGRWRLRTRLSVAGIDRWSTTEPATAFDVLGSAVDDRLDRLRSDGAEIVLETGAGTWGERLDGLGVRRHPSGGRELVATLPVGASKATATRAVAVRLERDAGGPATIRIGRLEPREGQWAVVLTIGPLRGRLRRGRWKAAAALDGEDRPWSPLGTVVVDVSGRAMWSDGRRVGLLRSVGAHAGRLARLVGRRLLDGPLAGLRRRRATRRASAAAP